MFKREPEKVRHTHHLSEYLENQLKYAAQFAYNGNTIKNVYSSMSAYKTAFQVTEQPEYERLCQRYIERVKILAKRVGVQL